MKPSARVVPRSEVVVDRVRNVKHSSVFVQEIQVGWSGDHSQIVECAEKPSNDLHKKELENQNLECQNENKEITLHTLTKKKRKKILPT